MLIQRTTRWVLRFTILCSVIEPGSRLLEVQTYTTHPRIVTTPHTMRGNTVSRMYDGKSIALGGSYDSGARAAGSRTGFGFARAEKHLCLSAWPLSYRRLDRVVALG
jgi:hypothetical protein